MTDKTSKMASIAPTQDIEIELATRPALRLWQAREKTEKKHAFLASWILFTSTFARQQYESDPTRFHLLK